ncbi:outer membrane protein assembly factor BamB [Streptacidiphilus sp. MAP12-33]|uniref:outer membrane protein assembly factor BamB family protein n=1 Tax=Streptacidiphilus sp. MAP12-33 TaxID=3156266 RepID=UPI0035140BD9
MHHQDKDQNQDQNQDQNLNRPDRQDAEAGRRLVVRGAVASGLALSAAIAYGLTRSRSSKPTWPLGSSRARPRPGPASPPGARPSATPVAGGPPTPLWRIALNRPSDERPLLAGGKVLVKANLRQDVTGIADLQAYDSATGNHSWTYPGVAALDVTEAHVAADRVVLREELGSVLVLDPVTGRRTAEFGADRTGLYVLVVEGSNGSTVYTWGTLTTSGDPLAGNAPAAVAAWDSQRGMLLWHQPALGTLAHVQAMYVAGQGALVFSVDVADHVIGRDAATGAVRWSVDIGAEPTLGAHGAPFYAVSEPLGLCFTTRRKTVAWDASTGTERWNIGPRTAAHHFGESLLSGDGRTLFTTELGPGASVLAVDAASGAVRWRRSPGALTPDGRIALCGPDLLVVPAGDGSDGIWGLDTADGSQRWHYSEPATTSAPWQVATDPAAGLVAACQQNTLLALPLG